MGIAKQAGGFPHVFWIDLKGDRVLTETVVLREDGFGNTYFIELPILDGIDKNRLVKILTSRNATNFELWDLMSQVTLNNGINALEYFHQLVKVITPEGIIMNPRAGVVGTGRVDTQSAAQKASIALNNATVENVQGENLSPQQKRAATIAKNKAAEAAANSAPDAG